MTRPPKLHWLQDGMLTTACGMEPWMVIAASTSERSEVTCMRCKASSYWSDGGPATDQEQGQ